MGPPQAIASTILRLNAFPASQFDAIPSLKILPALWYKMRMKGGPKTQRPPANALRRPFVHHHLRHPNPTFNSAFSAIELLVTVGLILLLATMYWSPGSTEGKRQRRIACQKNLQKSYIGLQIYANEHAGRFPSLLSARTSDEPLDLLIPKYTSDTSIFTCPASKDSSLPQAEPILNRKISYAYYMGRVESDGVEA